MSGRIGNLDYYELAFAADGNAADLYLLRHVCASQSLFLFSAHVAGCQFRWYFSTQPMAIASDALSTTSHAACASPPSTTSLPTSPTSFQKRSRG